MTPMEFLRKKARTIFIGTTILVIPAFVYWGAGTRSGSQDPSVVAVVNGVKIGIEQYNQTFRNIEERYREQLGDGYDRKIAEMLGLKMQALNQLVQRILFLQEAEKLGLRISDETVIDYIRTYDVFKTDGKFDAAKWNKAVDNSQIDWGVHIQIGREHLMIRELERQIQSGARVTDQEVLQAYRLVQEKIRLAYLPLDPADFRDEIEVPEAEARTYFEERRVNYQVPEEVRCKYVLIEIAPSARDEADIRDIAEQVRDRALSGEDFANLARRYSDDPGSAGRGGDTGFFSRGRMVQEFEDAAFALEPGQISDIVRTQFGLHIIKTEEKREREDQEEVRARHILFQLKPGIETLRELSHKVGEVAAKARVEGLEAAASEFSLDVSETPLFGRESKQGDPTMLPPEVIGAAFSLDPGGVSEVMTTDVGHYVVQLEEKRESYVPNFDQIENRVREELAEEKAEALASKKASEVASAASSLDALEGLYPELAESVVVSEPFSQMESLPEFGYSTSIANMVFRLPVNKISEPFPLEDKVYLFQVLEKIPIDMKEYERHKEIVRERVLREKRSQLFNDFFLMAKSRAEIKINEETLGQL